jgi:hypothetical protein
MRHIRWIYAALATVTIPCGLATRPLRAVIGAAVAENLGDALWAMLVYCLLAGFLPKQPSRRIALAAMVISMAVECSQLYHAPWLDAIRRTTIGGLILGWGFAWGDLIAYACGVGVAFVLDKFLLRRPHGLPGKVVGPNRND